MMVEENPLKEYEEKNCRVTYKSGNAERFVKGKVYCRNGKFIMVESIYGNKCTINVDTITNIVEILK